MTELSIPAAAKKYRINHQTILDAIRAGRLPAFTVTVLELRVKPKDVAAYAAAMSQWRSKAGKKGAAKKWANYRARQASAIAPRLATP